MTDRIVQVTLDNSGQVTIRLVGWSEKDLKRLAGTMFLAPASKQIGRALAQRLADRRQGGEASH